jgi:hypothetical protein
MKRHGCAHKGALNPTDDPCIKAELGREPIKYKVI